MMQYANDTFIAITTCNSNNNFQQIKNFLNHNSLGTLRHNIRASSDIYTVLTFYYLGGFFLLNELSTTTPEVEQKIGGKNKTRRSKKISRPLLVLNH